ncbi:MAG TPA: TOMM precursor leader peptide-binding protein, partial [Actinomycetota bacterium]
VHSLGSVPAGPMVRALEPLVATTGHDARNGAEGATLELVLVDDYLDDRLGEVNRLALASGRPWMPVKPVGRQVWLGPIFAPGVTGCWECLAQRLRSNRQMEGFLQRRSGGSRPLVVSRAALAPCVDAALQLAASEAAKFIVSADLSMLGGQVVTLDTRTLATRHHALTRRPQCGECGDAAGFLRLPEPVVLRSRSQASRSDGGHRSVHPEVTYSRLEHHVSPITGVVTELTDLTGEDNDGLLYSYSAGHNFALMRDELSFLLHNLRGRSGGKGATRIQAQVSAMCEAIERYSGVYRAEAFEVRSSYNGLDARAYRPNDLMLISERQFAHRDAWNAEHASSYHKVPVRFEEGEEVAWTPVWSLTAREHVYVPSAYCWYGHPDLARSFFSTCDANGSAAGNNVEEAVLQGFMELVERDSVALWWYNRLRRPEVGLASFGDPFLTGVRGWYEDRGRCLYLLDITSDLGIAAFAAVSYRTDHPVQDIVLGFGAHFDPRVAARRAVTEVNQFMPSVSQRRDDGSTVYWFPDPEAVAWWQTATIDSDPHVLPAPGRHLRYPDDCPDRSAPDLRAEVECCIETCEQRGLEMLVLDQTQPDIGLSVVKVMVPGLRHFWKRFGPGRLYDVPVRMGWLEKATPERDLNPTGIFF